MKTESRLPTKPTPQIRLDRDSCTPVIDPKSPPKHLFVLIHGLNGHYSQMNYLEKRFKESYKDEMLVLKASCNSGGFLSTSDGIDYGGNRLCEEIRNVVSLNPSLKEFSILGNSLGGLYARYCVGHLFNGPDRLFLKPKNFITTSTPHLGIQQTMGFFSRMGLGVMTQMSRNFHRTATQLMLADETLSERPLLLQMTEPGSIYMESLALFQIRILFANYLNDKLVPYCTAGVVPYLPTKTMTVNVMSPLDVNFPHIVGVHDDDEGVDMVEKSLEEGRTLFYRLESLEMQMIYNLRRLSWLRVEALFEDGTNPHDTLAVANGCLSGQDVVDFMLSRFFPVRPIPPRSNDNEPLFQPRTRISISDFSPKLPKFLNPYLQSFFKSEPRTPAESSAL